MLHDSILNEYGLSPEGRFDRGSLRSVYDARGNVSSIEFCYL